MRSFFGGFAGSYWWYGPRIRREMGQTTPEKRRAAFSVHPPSVLRLKYVPLTGEASVPLARRDDAVVV